MTPHDFRQKWTGHHLKERSAAQEHFIDLCRMLDHPTPAEADPEGTWFCFERGAEKLGGGDGWADVWKRGFFGWEYKGLHANLDAAFRQLQDYRDDLENPPLLVVCDTDIIRVCTNFTGTKPRTYTVRLQSIDDPESIAILKAVFFSPDKLRPDDTPLIVTEHAAERVGTLADNMRLRGIPGHDAAHFLMKLIFCLFAEDVGLLPEGIMARILQDNRADPVTFDDMLRGLLGAMRTGGNFGAEKIDYFDGGLFDDDATIPLDRTEIASLAEVSKLDWSRIEPAIFGTLFERSLDPAKRAQLGAHYTSRQDIELIIEPVLMDPLRDEWAIVRDECDDLAGKRDAAPRGKKRQNLTDAINRKVADFMHRLSEVRVLDPACGSGNFLYVALTSLKDLELEVIRATGRWSAEAPFPRVGPAQLFGLEIDAYASELAQLTVWIGYLQWMRGHGYFQEDRPILKPLHNIEQRDAIVAVDEEGKVYEPEWPEAYAIVGNPPFLGGKKLRTELGDEYVESMFAVYDGRVPREADLCCYWFERARAEIAVGRAKRAGLLATNSIGMGPQMRPVLERLAESGGIFLAWSDRDWILDGAAVRIAMVGFDDGAQTKRTLDDQPVSRIHADLTSGSDLTEAKRLRANAGLSFMGDTKGGAFDIDSDLARKMLTAPNPLDRSNADVVKPWANGMDVTRRSRGMWIIDFGVEMPEREAALYEMPFEYVREHVLAFRQQDRQDAAMERRWWLHMRPRSDMRHAIAGRPRYLASPRVAKHRLFAWMGERVVPDCQLIVFARDDDYFFGVLHSHAHEKWSLAVCSWLGVGNDPRYTPSTCFETFPFPVPTDDKRAAISAPAKALHETRQSALDADEKLTLTGLYNKMPTWLANLHGDLDRAVFAAYGWDPDISDEELLEKLLALNLERAEEEAQGILRKP